MANTFDDLMTMGHRAEHRQVEFLPDPAPRPRTYLIFSVDDHVCEAADTFVSRVAARYVEAAPRVVSDGRGEKAWLIDGQLRRWTGGDSIAGRKIDDMHDLLRGLWFDDMRPGTYDSRARIRDMDL